MEKIPEHAKCVFRGITYDVYQWEQEMFDGTYSTFEILKRKLGVEIIPVIDNKILILKEEQPFKGSFLSFVGGTANNDDEDALSVAKREFLEETGMIAKDYILWNQQKISGRIYWNSHYFIAKGCEKIQESNLDNGEKIEILLITFEELIEEVQKESFRNQYLKNVFLKMIHTPGELDKFKKMLFD